MTALSTLLKPRALRHCAVIGCEVLAVCVAVAVISGGGLIWLLSRGPLDIAPLKPHIEAALSQEGVIEASIDATYLSWSGIDGGIDLTAEGVLLHPAGRADSALRIEELGIDVALSELMRGRLRVQEVDLLNPRLGLQRAPDGSLMLGLAEQPQDTSRQGLDDLIQAWHGARAGKGPLSRLRSITIAGAALTLNDQRAGQPRDWQIPRLDLVLALDRDQLRASGRAELALGEGAAPLALKIEAAVAPALDDGRIDLAFSQLNPDLLARIDAALAPLSALNAPVSGSLRIVLAGAQAADAISLEAEIGTGLLDLPDLYPLPLPLAGGSAAVTVNPDRLTARIDQLMLDLEGPVLSVTGEAALVADGMVEAALTARLAEVPIDDLIDLWPPMIPQGGRGWIVTHLFDGVARTATANLAGRFPLGDPAALEITRLEGDMAVEGVRVRYLDGLPHAVDVAGTARFDRESFTLTFQEGRLEGPEHGDIRVVGGTAPITGLTGSDHRIHIDMQVAGPLRAALAVLDLPRLGYVSALGLSPDQLSGDAMTRVQFKFPLKGTLQMDQVWVLAEAAITGLTADDILLGGDLTDGAIELAIDTKKLTASGSGRYFGAPIAFDWTEIFSPGEDELATSLTMTGAVDRQALVDFGLPADPFLDGIGDLALNFSVFPGDEGLVAGTVDLTGMIVDIPFIGIEKPVGEAGESSFVVSWDAETPARVSEFELIAGPVSAAGEIDLTPEGGIERLQLRRLEGARTAAAVDLQRMPTGGFAASISGQALDLDPLLAQASGRDSADRGMAAAPAAPPEMPLEAAVELAQLGLGGDAPIRDLRAHVSFDGKVLQRLGLDAMAGSGLLSIQYLPGENGHTLEVNSDDTGAVLRALDLGARFGGGVMRIAGASTGPESLAGTIEVADLTVLEAPLLARLLNAFSPTGLAALLGGDQGILFRRIAGGFEWRDGALHFSGVRAAGASLGLTLDEGYIDPETGTLDLAGTLVPVYGFSEMVGAVPLLGDILTGGDGGGIFAATYRISGPLDDPAIAVNPLSVLTPGFLRNVFFLPSDREPPRPDTGAAP